MDSIHDQLDEFVQARAELEAHLTQTQAELLQAQQAQQQLQQELHSMQAQVCMAG